MTCQSGEGVARGGAGCQQEVEGVDVPGERVTAVLSGQGLHPAQLGSGAGGEVAGEGRGGREAHQLRPLIPSLLPLEAEAVLQQ